MWERKWARREGSLLDSWLRKEARREDGRGLEVLEQGVWEQGVLEQGAWGDGRGGGGGVRMSSIAVSKALTSCTVTTKAGRQHDRRKHMGEGGVKGQGDKRTSVSKSETVLKEKT